MVLLIASLEVIWGREARLFGKSVMTPDEGCQRTANLEDDLDIDKKRLSSKDENPEVLGFAARGRKGEFWLLLIFTSL